MRYGRALLAVLGVLIAGTGLVGLFVASTPVPGTLALVVGVVVVLLAVLPWTAFEAEITELLRLRVANQPAQPPASAPAPELRILSLEERGGNATEIDFSAEIVNQGTQFCRAQVSADVGGQPVCCHPTWLDLPPNDPPRRMRIFVPRTEFGDLVSEFANAATLYGRTLTVHATCGEKPDEAQWREHVYTTEENSVRAQIQQRVWRIGLGEGTEADFRAEAQSELLRRHEERLTGDR